MKIVIDMPDENYQMILTKLMLDFKGCEITEFPKGYEIKALEERLQGRWIKGREISRTMIGDEVLQIDYKDYTCSNCRLVLDRLLYNHDGSPFYKFCPNCGADMRGKE